MADKGYLEPLIVEQLLASYTFLRNLEHRLQYLDDAQTHTLPANDADRLAVAQMMGLPDTATLLAQLEAHRVFVAGQFDEMFSDKSSGTPPADTGIDPQTSNDCAARTSRNHRSALRRPRFHEPAACARRCGHVAGARVCSPCPRQAARRLVASSIPP